jgi:hypothetical protein
MEPASLPADTAPPPEIEQAAAPEPESPDAPEFLDYGRDI